ncbi:hypothetical protein GCK32_000804 [Trichostrongylus colubriformis]|uniref:Uncharacterized protein n=1 Tax=Trichostrongylus colubriformis TaxID=6319 RepID=A0AAN8IM96_TRICO
MPNAVFKLDTSQRRFFTCCGKVHVKMAFLFIIAMTVVAEVMEAAFYVVNGMPEGTTFFAFALEIWEYVVTVSMVIALVHENSLFLFPYIGEMFVVVTMMLIMLFQLLFCMISPYSSTAEQFFIDGRYTLLQREKKLLAILLVVTFFSGLAVWFLNIGLSTYVYFDYLAHKRNRRPRRLPEAPAQGLVQQDALASSAVAVSISFPNPNFATNSDEDDEVFAKGAPPPPAAV